MMQKFLLAALLATPLTSTTLCAMEPEDALEDDLNKGYQSTMQIVAENLVMADQIVEGIARKDPPIQNGNVPVVMRTGFGPIVEKPVDQRREREKLDLKIDLFSRGMQNEKNKAYNRLDDNDKAIADSLQGENWGL